MRLTLVFSPLVQPTYVPLGISSLVAVLRQVGGRVSVRAHDLSIAGWHWAARTCTEGRLFQDLGRAPVSRLFDPGAYRAFQGYWSNLSRILKQGQQYAHHYVQTGDLHADLRDLLDDLLAPVLQDEPECVGFSVMYLEQLSYSLALARRLREYCPQRHIVLGGAALSALDAWALVRACPYVDAVLLGEGEQALVQLAQGRSWASLPGAVVRQGDAGPQTPAGGDGAFNPFPTPAFDVWDLRQYVNPLPVLPLVMSRDCPWRRCRFCVHNRSFSGYREKTVEDLVDDMAYCIHHYRTRHFYLADQYVPAHRLHALSEAILRRGLSLHFHVMARPTAAYTGRILALAAAAGCRWISWGVESGSQRLLDLIHKGTRRDAILQVLRDSHRAGITNLAMMIFGLPTSTTEDLDQTLDFLDECHEVVSVFTASRFVLFEGTDLARQAESLGLVIGGRERLLQVGDQRVNGTRLEFQVRGSDGRLYAPPVDFEIERWRQRRRWYQDQSLLEQLPSEHLLLYCSSWPVVEQSEDPHRPQRRPRRAA